MLQDHLGRMWIATSNDIECFDGNRFYSLREFGFPSVGVSKLAEDREGAIWSASGEGLHRFYQGRLEKILGGFGTVVAEIAPGVVIASVGNSAAIPVNPTLVRVQRIESKWRIERMMELSFQGQFTVASDGKIVYLCPHGWCETDANEIVKWQPGKTLPAIRHDFPTPPTGSSAMVLRDRFGCVWVRSDTKSYYQCPEDPSPRSMPLSSNAAIVREANDGTVMIPSPGSLVIGRPGTFQVLNSRNGLPILGDVQVAKDGTAWLASAGLFRWPFPLNLEFWDERNGIDDGVWSVTRINGKMLLTAGGRILKLSQDRTRWENFASSEGGGIVQQLVAGPNKTIFAAVRQSGVFQFKADGTLIARSKPSGTLAMMLAHTPEGQLWATGAGVMRVEQVGNQLITNAEDLPGSKNRGLDMEVDRSGRLWACYDGGLVVKEPSGWRRITVADGLLENGCRSLAVTASGDVWYGYHGTPAFSLLHFGSSHSLQISHFRSGGEIGNADVVFFDADHLGRLWRGTPDGVYVSDSSNAENGHWARLGMEDGLPSADANQQSFFDDPDGSVWFGASRSVVHLKLSPQDAFPHLAPQVFVSGFSWNGRTPLIVDAVTTLPRDTDMIAHLGSLQFDRRSILNFRYRLLPRQATWQETRDVNLKLGKLPWGTNTLEVQARMASGPWSNVTSKSFLVEAPLWWKWQFLTLLILTSAALVIIWFGWHRRMAVQTATALPDLTEWRMTALEPAVHDLVGNTLDERYDVGALIARGGFGAVLDAYDREQNRRCAIKVFRHDGVDDARMSQALLREVSALERIHHHNVVQIYGHGTTPGGAPYLVMEFVEGSTLRRELEAGALPPERIAHLLLQAGEALGQMHAGNIYHRDLKPENIMLRVGESDRTNLVLIDFSIAIIKDPNVTIHGLTMAAGSIEYMAPEQLIGYVDEASDIYSLARIVIEMMTGKRLALLLPDASLDLPPRARELLQGLPLKLSEESLDLLSTALDYHPRERPRDAAEFARRIARDLVSGTIRTQS